METRKAILTRIWRGGGYVLRGVGEVFDADTPPFDESWRQLDKPYAPNEKHEGFESCAELVCRQAVDLREMDENGTLANEMRYFGVSAPRGPYWFNFDPCTFLECAVAGSFGGWQPGDDTGRDYVPGKVAVIVEDGSIESDPRELDDPIFPMPKVSWRMFRDFLDCGQNYE